MKNITLENIARVTGGTLYGATADAATTEAASVVIDSRQITEGGIFIATKGERVDGHSFIPAVFAAGALGVICEEAPQDAAGPYVLVEDSFKALREIGEFYRKQLDIKVVGITGSVGKTSTKEFIAGVLETKLNVLKTAGNYNNEIGVPLTILRIRKEHEVAVLEMGINHFGEMHRLTQMARPDICVITNIGECHLEFLGSREGILKAKTEIFDYSNPEGDVILNGEDDMLRKVENVHGKMPIFVGFGENCDVYASDVVSNGLLGSTCKIHMGEMVLDAKVSLPGMHQVSNAMVAAKVGMLLGLSKEEIEKGLLQVMPTAGRGHLIDKGSYLIVDDCYNANPVSMKAAIDLLTDAKGRKVAVLGDMFELGENEKELHYGVGQYAAEKGIDLVLLAGELSKEMEKAILATGTKTQVVHYLTRDLLMEDLPNRIKKGDTILVKASHGMGYQNIVEKLELPIL